MSRLNELRTSDILNISRNAGKYSRNRDEANNISLSKIDILDIVEGSNDLCLNFYVAAKSQNTHYRISLCIIDFVKALNEYYESLGKDINKLFANLRNFFIKELSTAQIKVNCTCPDFVYRFKDSARKLKIYNGIDKSDEFRGPNPNKINPQYRGSACKHILKLLSIPSMWIGKVVSSLIDLLKTDKSFLIESKSYNLKKFFKKYALTPPSKAIQILSEDMNEGIEEGLFNQIKKDSELMLQGIMKGANKVRYNLGKNFLEGEDLALSFSFNQKDFIFKIRYILKDFWEIFYKLYRKDVLYVDTFKSTAYEYISNPYRNKLEYNAKYINKRTGESYNFEFNKKFYMYIYRLMIALICKELSLMDDSVLKERPRE